MSDELQNAARRRVIQALAVAVPSTALTPWIAWGNTAVRLDWPDDESRETGLMRVALFPAPGRALPSSSRVLIKIHDQWAVVPKAVTDGVYEIAVPPKRAYSIRVVTPSHLTLERSIVSRGSLSVARFNLVPDGWPYYFMGGIEMPFEANPRLAGVALGRGISDSEAARLTVIAEQQGFARVIADPRTRGRLDSVNNSALFFEPKDPSAPIFSFDPNEVPGRSRLSPDAVLRLEGVFAGFDGRVGAAVRLTKGQIRIIDSYFLVRFRGDVAETEVRDFARSIGAELIRESDRSLKYWLIKFADPQNVGRHLHAMSSQLAAGVLVSAEPNLHFQLGLNMPPGISPKPAVDTIRNLICRMTLKRDPFEKCQGYLARQQVQHAWCYLEQFVPGGMYGLPSVKVATIDDGISFQSSSMTSSHADVHSVRLGYCYDLQNDTTCTQEASSLPSHIHGMAVYGIVSGKPDNDFAVNGIAPEVTHVAVEFTSVISNTERYYQTLMWVGGARQDPPSDRPGATNPIPSADIINCSHSLEGDPVPDSVDCALKKLTCEGRNGLGTIVVYSASNQRRYLPDANELATHPHTIGVANTEIEGGNEVRQHQEIDCQIGPAQHSSNFGPFIDLCAIGELAGTLHPKNTHAGPACDGSSGAGQGVFLFKGTSAAAPMVSAAAALILTINPKLTWHQVRSILCASAEKIDCANDSSILDCDGVSRSGSWYKKDNSPSTSPPPETCADLPRGLEWFSDWYGFGRLDVFAAVKLAHVTESKRPPSCDSYEVDCDI